MHIIAGHLLEYPVHLPSAVVIIKRRILFNNLLDLVNPSLRFLTDRSLL
jgi:hypothetical protein